MDTDEKTQIVDCYLLYGKWSKVSTVLDIPLRTLYRKRVKYNIDEEVRVTDDELHDLVSKVMEEQEIKYLKELLRVRVKWLQILSCEVF